jgi:response regulator RpfG family c-di-GMP phosphodiesterase
MNILLIEDQAQLSNVLRAILVQKFKGSPVIAPSLQRGIEIIESKEEIVELVICDYHGQSLTLLKSLLSLVKDLPCIVFAASPEKTLAQIKDQSWRLLEVVSRADPSKDLLKAIAHLEEKEAFKAVGTPDSDFIAIKSHRLAPTHSLGADIYIRLAPDKYLKLLRRDEHFEADDLERYITQKKITTFYVHSQQLTGVLQQKGEKLDQLINQKPEVDPEVARVAMDESCEVIHDVVHRMGFTEQMQEVARKTVALAMQVMGTNPKLNDILKRLKQNEGKYLTSHSMMLGEVACAVAAQVGWKSAPTFLKLTLAALMHDLPLTDNKLARCESLAQAPPEQAQEMKLHPVRAAEYARQFKEMPPDVDTIIVQHHEQPDGSGFPRGLFHQHIAPLSIIFLIAEDFLHYYLDDPNGSLKTFLALRKKRYCVGSFQKIFTSLETGKPLDA